MGPGWDSALGQTLGALASSPEVRRLSQQPQHHLFLQILICGSCIRVAAAQKWVKLAGKHTYLHAII